jgi:hypothetical protein
MRSQGRSAFRDNHLGLHDNIGAGRRPGRF